MSEHRSRLCCNIDGFRWLDVEVGSGDIYLNTLPANLCLADLSRDNEYKLLVGDLGRNHNEEPKLKIFRGTMQTSDLVLPDSPLSVVALYMNESIPHSPPLIAVAFGSSVYIYRNMKLFFKYYLPSIEWSSSEMAIWNKLIDPSNHRADTIKVLTSNLQALPQSILSKQSEQFLQLNTDQQLEYLELTPEIPVRIIAEVTAVTTLKFKSIDRYAASCLVVGTDDGDIIVLEPQTFTQIHQAKICEIKKTPYQIIATGLYNVEYRIVVATREKSVCVLKRESKEGHIIFSTEEHIVGFEVLSADHSIIVICTDHTMACYSKKGKKQWSMKLTDRPVCMCLLPITHLGVVLVGVALTSGHVLLFDGKTQVDSIFVKDTVSVLKFGQLGQEEHVLIIVTATGNLMLKILRRVADFNVAAAGDVTRTVSKATRPWLIPKKSKLFIEQSVREKENAVAMHEGFQRELNRLRLNAAKTLIEAHAKSDNSIGAGALEPVRLSAEVEGLGPVFRMILVVENTSKEKAVVALSILFHHTTNYKVTNPFIKVPLLTPGSKIRFPTKVEEIFSDLSPDVMFRAVTGQGGERSIIKVLLLKEGRQSPVLAATVEMPPTDPMMMPFDKMQISSDFA